MEGRTSQPGFKLPLCKELQQATRINRMQLATALPDFGGSVGCFQYRVLQLRRLFLDLQCPRWTLRDGFTNLCLRRCARVNYKLSVFHLEHRRGTFHTFSGVNTGISVICYFHRKFPPSYFLGIIYSSVAMPHEIGVVQNPVRYIDNYRCYPPNTLARSPP